MSERDLAQAEFASALQRVRRLAPVKKYVRFLESGMGSGDAMTGESIRRGHKGTLSCVTALMNGVAPQTG
jgi:hypothetical protein